jgi:hypothetical protein
MLALVFMLGFLFAVSDWPNASDADTANTTTEDTHDDVRKPETTPTGTQETPTKPSPVQSTASIDSIIREGTSHVVSLDLDEEMQTWIELLYLSGDLDLELRSPSGIDYSEDSVQDDPDIGWYDEKIPGGRIESVTLTAPEVGRWTVTISAPSIVEPSDSARYVLSASFKNPRLTLAVELPELHVATGDTLIVKGILRRDGAAVNGQIVKGWVRFPDESLSTFTLQDDGLTPDSVASDGIYTGQLTSTGQVGMYGFLLIASGGGHPGLPAFTRQEGDFATVSASRTVAIGAKSGVIDSDGNGRYNLLYVDVDLSVTADATYLFTGVLSDLQGNEFADHAELELAAGTRSVRLRFDGSIIFDREVDGPYTLRDLWINELHNGAFLPVAHERDLHVTAAYDYHSFEP